MEDFLIMSNKELEKSKIMDRLIQGSLQQKQAAKALGISTRQVKRILRAYRLHGDQGLISKKRGKESNNQLPKELKNRIVELIRSQYPDFRPTLACEKLQERDKIVVSVSTVRNLMIEHKIWFPKRAKEPVVHQLRERRPCFGELVQIDGSPHDWFEGRAAKCTLLVFIDDATGRVLQLWFRRSEDLQGYFEACHRYFPLYGRPMAWYLDRSGIFRVNQGKNRGISLTQFARAMKELGIELIHASTPQAKGRVERVNRTLQDRLVKELRLRKISDIETANKFLPTFIEDYNRRFAVVPKDPTDAHRSLLPHHNLVLCHTEKLGLIYRSFSVWLCARSHQPTRGGFDLRTVPVEKISTTQP